MPKAAMEYFADATGLHVRYTVKDGLRGSAKVRVPMTENMRLVCPLRIVASMYRKAAHHAAIVLHVRQDFYLLIGYDCKSGGAVMLALDGTEVDKIEDLFSRAKDLPTVYGRCSKGVVKAWAHQAKGGTWTHQSVDCLV